MYRKSTDLEYYRDGRVVIDADGIPVELGYRGVGFPEGKIAAPVGSIYTDTAVTNGAIRWIKTSGTGNTGWVVEYGDTGWRDITDEYLSREGDTGVLEMGAGSKILIRRTDGNVYFRLLGPITAQATYGSILRILSGWRPELDTEVSLSRGVSVRHTRYWITIESATQGDTIANANRTVIGQWPTMESWPSSLPGTPI